MSPKDDYLRWRIQPPVGCMFARFIAGGGRAADHGQTIESVPTPGTALQAAQFVSDRVDSLVADPDVQAAALLLPEVTSLEQTASIFLALEGLPNWIVTTTTIQNHAAGEMVAIRIVRTIPFGDGTCPSEALVLGPFHEFPPTRRAPLVAFEIFVGQPLEYDPKTGEPTTKANLAHMKLPMVKNVAIDKMWERSKKDRLNSLGGTEDNRAKAKVSFVIAPALAIKLGCHP